MIVILTIIYMFQHPLLHDIAPMSNNAFHFENKGQQLTKWPGFLQKKQTLALLQNFLRDFENMGE